VDGAEKSPKLPLDARAGSRIPARESVRRAGSAPVCGLGVLGIVEPRLGLKVLDLAADGRRELGRVESRDGGDARLARDEVVPKLLAATDRRHYTNPGNDDALARSGGAAAKRHAGRAGAARLHLHARCRHQ